LFGSAAKNVGAAAVARPTVTIIESVMLMSAPTVETDCVVDWRYEGDIGVRARSLRGVMAPKGEHPASSAACISKTGSA
jgi:hypothetical protein